MATTINSGYANSPKLTANIADHADVYGGRALVFDGVSDYLDCGESLCDSLGDNYSGGLTVSMWFNANALLRGLFSMGTSFSSYTGLFTLRFNSNKLVWDLGNANYEESSALSTGQWYQVTAVLDTNSESNTILYINGKSDMNLNGSGSFPSVGALDFQAVSKTIIGGYYSTSYLFDGKIADVKIFDSALTEAQVQELYKKPENTPSAVQDNLVAWYPMIEGNPENPQSIVYDHSEKKLGTNLVTNSTFDSDITGWSLDGTRSNTSISHSTIDSKTCVDISDQSTSDRIYARFDLGDNAIDGELYKISYYVRKAQTGSTSKDFIIGLGFSNVGGDAGNVDKTVAEYDTWEFQEAYIICGSSNNYIQFLPTAYDNSHIGRLFLDDVKVQKVLMGNHATTNFFGDMSDVLSSTQKTNMDAILESDDNNFDFSDTAGNQVTQSTLGSEELGTWTNNSSYSWDTFTSSGTSITSAISDASGVHIATNPFSSVSGKIYKITFNLTLNSGTVPQISIRETVDGTIGDGLSIGASSEGVNTYYFQASSTKTLYLFFNLTDTASNWSASSISIKEITTTKFFPLFGSDEISGNTLKLTNAGTTKAHVALPFTTVVGKSYNAEIKLTTANMQGGLSVSDDIAENTLSTASSSGSIITSNTFVAIGTTSYVHIKNNQGNNNQYNLYDNLKVREVGITSSGFETAVNEPVVPQVPLMRYNQKMLISSDASADTYVLLPDGLTKGLTEFTFSIWHKKNIGDSSILFAVDGGGSYIRFLTPTRLFAHMPGQTGSFTLDVSGITDDGNLHHYVLSMSASSNESKLYIDGVLKETDTNDGNYYNSNIRRIGNYAGVQSPSMHDEFSIFNTALTQTQVQELFNDGVALDATTHSKKGNLLGYWRNDGVTTWTDRRGWSYLDFDGNDKIVTNLNSTPADATYIWWMKATATNTNAVFGHGTSSQTGFILNWAGTNKPLLYLNSSNFRYFSLNDAQDDGAWHCFALVNDNDNITNAKLYIDGVEQSATSTTSTGADPSHSTGLTIGYASSYFNGSIAQFAVYSDLKDSTFITSKFNQGINSDLSSDTNLVAYYKMDNTSTIIDLIGSNNGTVTGTTLNTGNDGDVQGSPDSITIREGLNSNRDGLGFYFTNPSSNVLRLGRIHGEYLNVGSPKSLDDIWHGGGTVELWVKPEGETGNMGIMHKAGNGNQGWTLKTDTYSNGWHLRFDAIFSGANYTFQKNSYLKKDIWTYIAVTYSSNAGEQATIYTSNESGVLSAITSPNTNTTSTDTYTSDAGQDLIIGSKEGDSTKFNGLMDEIRIYNRALSLDEITKNFKHQKGKHKND
jgi:hypothetical protein